MKIQDSSFNGLKVTVGTKSVTHAPTHPRTNGRSKSNMPHQLFQSWGHKKIITDQVWAHPSWFCVRIGTLPVLQ